MNRLISEWIWMSWHIRRTFKQKWVTYKPKINVKLYASKPSEMGGKSNEPKQTVIWSRGKVKQVKTKNQSKQKTMEKNLFKAMCVIPKWGGTSNARYKIKVYNVSLSIVKWVKSRPLCRCRLGVLALNKEDESCQINVLQIPKQKIKWKNESKLR